MGKRLLLMLLLALAGSMAAMAQTPEPDGRWTFEDTDNLMAPSVGNMQMIPAIVSNNSITPATIGEASITTTTGPAEGKSAIKVPRSSALKVVRPEGAEASQSYSLMMDVMTPDASPWNSLLQTAEDNGNDGDLFFHANQVGINSMGGYFGTIKNGKWYRVVLSYRDGKNILYVNGKKLATANPDNNDRFKIQPFGFYLFCDEDGELAENYVSEVAFWETPLTDEQVSELGSALPPPVMEIATPADMKAFADAVESGADVTGMLTADINLAGSEYSSLMIGNENAKFSGVFDGQGHTITIHYEGDCLAGKWRGLFRAIDGATIRNLRVDGDAIPTNIHFGALIGVAYSTNGDVIVENVVTNVDITGQRSGVTGDAGMLGANYANIIFNNCAVLGPMGYPGSSMYSPYSGWSDGSSSVTLNNCYAACYFKEGTVIDGDSGTLTHGSGTKVFNNSYYLNYIDKVQGTQVTAEQIASGALCYKLNGDQSNIVWTQNIGVDEFPMPDPAGPRVYGSGTLRCDGTELEDSPLTYSNTESYPVIPDHQFGLDGICTVCGMTDPNAVTQNADGFYLIGSPEQMYWLSLKVQESNAALKVLLTDDIDLANSDFPDLMLGSEGRQFTGIFDGAKHTVTVDYVIYEDYCGLFRYAKDATIRNLRVEGTAVSYDKIFTGGLIGMVQGDVVIENVVTDVDITGVRQNVTGHSGMVGANYGNVTINNCSTHGEMGGEGSSMYCGFVCYDAGGTNTTLNNCFTTWTLVEGTGTGYCYTLSRDNSNVTVNNCYYLNANRLAGTHLQGTQIMEEELASGALCYKLNGDQSNIRWYQTLGQDEMPVPDDNHLKVYGAGSIFMNVTDDVSFAEFIDRVIGSETERLEDIYAQKSLEDTYLADLNALRSAANINTFIAGYNALEEQRQAIQSCADAYTAYIAKLEYAQNYLNDNPDLNNEKVDLLKSYLTDFDGPGDDYPNGTSVYILDNCELNEEKIIAETARIDEMLTAAITYTPAPGTDISLLFTNIDLSDQFNGWEGTVPTGWGTSETSSLYAAECLAQKMDMYQTVTGLPNGIYELQINGAFRPTPYNNFYNVNYAATLYANAIHNFFQANIEDMISVEEAEDGVNCNINGPIADFAITDEDGEVIGYTMQGIVSCCNAFQAGRYPNYVLCNVTDGSLTIGVRQPGTSLSRDWLGFGNIKVFYYGQLNEAEEALDSVLSSQSARAKTILEVYKFDSGNDYAAYPNFSKALKDQLAEALAAVEDTTEPAAKYALIERFSELFLQIYESKQAYIHLMDIAEELGDILAAFTEILSDDDFNTLYDLQDNLYDGYVKGTMSTEEIYAINLNDYLDFFPSQDDEGNYLLSNAEDFNTFALMVNGGYTQINAKLLADINLAESEYPDAMIGTDAAQYGGTFDGQRHTITYNYTINENYCGLFRYMNGATVRNLRIEGNATVTAIHFGALVGYVNGTVLVEDVITNVNITGEHAGVTGDGGMVGRLEGPMTFNNCATLGTMGYEGSSMYCGFVAYAGNGSSILNNCYTACTLTEGTGTDYCHTFCRGTGTYNNCYYLNAIGEAQGKQMALEKFQSGEVCYKLNGDQSDIHWYQSIGTDEFPVLDNTHKIVYMTADGSYSNEKAHTGTEDDPFVVKSAADLSNLIKLLISGRMNYVVMEADVDMADVRDWTPLFNIDDQSNGYPYIDFDGQNHVIRNLTSNTTGAYDYCGVFGVLCGNVRNLGVENATIECAGGTGILAGYLGHSSYGQTCYIENVWVTGKVTANGYCGGMFGNIADESHITNCYANVEVTGSGDLTGGIIGRVRNKVVMNNVYAAGTINRGGGIIGGGFQAATPDGSYTNVAVWNNTANNFGPARSTDALSGILYYDGTNFADLQSKVVAWDPTVWSCDMEPGSYPVLAAFDPNGIKRVTIDESTLSIYNLAGQRLSKMQRGINIINGRKVLVK